MKKNYNYNYVNRTAKPKTDIEFSNVESASCLSSVLKKSPVVDGRLWHTTDTNEFFYDWNGKRNKLNVTGDNASLLAEINKLKSDVAKLNPEKMDQLETKVNNAVSKVNNITSRVNSAISDAQAATQAAQAAASAVNDKVSQDELTSGLNEVKDMINNISLTPGPAGADGKDGKDGKDGVDGQPGANGADGQPGADGKDGKDGEDGLSAYEVAVNAGFNGTVEAWLASLKGTDGTNGVDGKDGKDGVDGQPGADGKDGKDGTNGADGQPGADGKDGKDGVDGKSAFEIAQENGFEGTEEEWLDSLKGEGLSQADRDLIDSLAEIGASDFSTGAFPVGDANIENASADENGLATVQDVMDYVRAYFEKKKDEIEPDGSEVPVAIPYLYTNGYRPSDTPIELTDPLNAYEIVLDGNGEFVIELVHKNEEGGWFEIEGDPDANYYGDFFKVIIPSDYEVKTYRWDSNTNDYTIDTETDMPACNLVEGSSTPDNVTYYYKDAVDGYLFNGAKTGVEDEIALYNNHWLKLVVTKK